MLKKKKTTTLESFPREAMEKEEILLLLKNKNRNFVFLFYLRSLKNDRDKLSFLWLFEICSYIYCFFFVVFFWKPLYDNFFLANSCRRHQPHTWLSYTLRGPEPDSVLPQEPLLAGKSSPHQQPDWQKVHDFTRDVNDLLEKRPCGSSEFSIIWRRDLAVVQEVL